MVFGTGDISAGVSSNPTEDENFLCALASKLHKGVILQTKSLQLEGR